MGEYLLGMNLDSIRLLDMGCGSGILSLVGASRGASVIAVDLNPAAVDATVINASANGLEERIWASVGNLFDPVAGQKFDLIVFNPPFYPGEPQNPADLAWRSGDNHTTLRRFLQGSVEHLAEGGKVLMILSTEMQMGTALRFFAEEGFQVKCVRSGSRLFEIISIWELSPRS